MIGRRSLLQVLGIGGAGAALGGVVTPTSDYPHPAEAANWVGDPGGKVKFSVEEQLAERLLKYKAFGLPRWWTERHGMGLNPYREPFSEMKSWSQTFKHIAQVEEAIRREEKTFVRHITNSLAEAAWRKIHPHYP